MGELHNRVSALHQTREALHTQELLCTLGIEMADEHMRHAIARRVLMSSHASRLQHRSDQFDVSCSGQITIVDRTARTHGSTVRAYPSQSSTLPCLPADRIVPNLM